MCKNGSRVSTASIGDIVSIPLKDKVNIGDIVVKTTDYNQLKELNEKINIDKKINIKGKCILKVGDPIKLYITDYKNEVELTSDYIVESAKSSETTIDRIKEQINNFNDEAVYKCFMRI
jgi:aspartyl-tRNA synthetase